MAESKRDYYEVLGVSKDADESNFEKSIQTGCQEVSPG